MAPKTRASKRKQPKEPLTYIAAPYTGLPRHPDTMIREFIARKPKIFAQLLLNSTIKPDCYPSKRTAILAFIDRWIRPFFSLPPMDTSEDRPYLLQHSEAGEIEIEDFCVPQYSRQVSFKGLEIGSPLAPPRTILHPPSVTTSTTPVVTPIATTTPQITWSNVSETPISQIPPLPDLNPSPIIPVKDSKPSSSSESRVSTSQKTPIPAGPDFEASDKEEHSAPVPHVSKEPSTSVPSVFPGQPLEELQIVNSSSSQSEQNPSGPSAHQVSEQLHPEQQAGPSSPVYEGPAKRTRTKSSKPRKKPRTLAIQSSSSSPVLPIQEPPTVHEAPASPMNQMAGRKIVTPLVVSAEHLLENNLGDLLQLLNKQGWTNLCSSPAMVNPDEVREFYSNLSVTISTKAGVEHSAQAIIRGDTLCFNESSIRRTLKTPKDGFGDLPAKTWGAFDKNEVLNRIYEGRVPRTKELSVHNLSLTAKLAHSLLIKNFVPRQEKRTSLTIQDAILLDLFLSGQPINLPRIILGHMSKCTAKNHSLPYPALVRMLLVKEGLYVGENEVSLGQELDTAVLQTLRHSEVPVEVPHTEPVGDNELLKEMISIGRLQLEMLTEIRNLLGQRRP